MGWIARLGVVASLLARCDSLPKQGLPPTVRVTSENTSPVVRQSIGVYTIKWVTDSEHSAGGAAAHYEMASETPGAASPLRILYRRTNGAKKGSWVVTSSAENMKKGKGTIVSTSDGPSPIGLTFNYYSAREWQPDETLAVSDATPPRPSPTTNHKSGSSTGHSVVEETTDHTKAAMGKVGDSKSEETAVSSVIDMGLG
jgi:hypothetical protein